MDERPTAPAPSPSRPLGDFEAAAQQFVAALCQYSPAAASYLGIHDHDAVLARPGEAAVERFGGALKATLDDLTRLPAAQSSREVAERKALAGMCTSALIELVDVRPWNRNPVRHLEELVGAIYLPMVRDHESASARAEAMRSRMEDVPGFLKAAREASRDVPALFAEIALEVGQTTDALLSETVLAWGQEQAPNVSLVEASARAGAALGEHLDWLAGCGRDDNSFMVGGDVFERLLAAEHGLECTTEDILRMGEDLLGQARQEIQEVARAGSCPDWQSAVAEAQVGHPDAQALLGAYGREVDKAREFTSRRGLVTLPSTPLEVVWTPEPLRMLVPYAAYLPSGAFDTSQRGLFWVTPPDASLSATEASERLAGHNWAAVALTTIHEGYPGHHVQRAVANQLPGTLPRVAGSALLIEGWAYYCEELAWEQGYFDEVTRLYQLKDQLWRASRVILDVKIHTGQMSVDEAVRALIDWAGLEEVAARAEVRRYTMTPTYQLAYAVGKQEILELRRRLKATQGEEFELRAFHDELLSYGSIPVPLIAQGMSGGLEALSPDEAKG